jgi:hypothetical protein
MQIGISRNDKPDTGEKSERGEDEMVEVIG